MGLTAGLGHQGTFRRYKKSRLLSASLPDAVVLEVRVPR